MYNHDLLHELFYEFDYLCLIFSTKGIYNFQTNHENKNNNLPT